MSTRGMLSLLIIAGVLFVGLLGCSSDDEGIDMLEPGAEVRATCEGCHTSEAMLKATVLPDPPPPESEGEG